MSATYTYNFDVTNSINFIRDGIDELIIDNKVESILIDEALEKINIVFLENLSTVSKKRLDKIIFKSIGKGTKPFESFYSIIRSEMIDTHDFALPQTWKNTNDSSWTLEPGNIESPFYGMKIVLTGIQVVFSEKLKMHSRLLINFYTNGDEEPIFQYVYRDMADWISRSCKKNKLDYQGEIGPFMQFEVRFPRQQIIWSSSGYDESLPKFNKMVLKIDDDNPYLTDDGQPCMIARGSYTAELYDDIDF